MNAPSGPKDMMLLMEASDNSANAILRDCQGQALGAIADLLDEEVKKLTLLGQTEDEAVHMLRDALRERIPTCVGNAQSKQDLVLAYYWYTGMNLLKCSNE